MKVLSMFVLLAMSLSSFANGLADGPQNGSISPYMGVYDGVTNTKDKCSVAIRQSGEMNEQLKVAFSNGITFESGMIGTYIINDTILSSFGLSEFVPGSSYAENVEVEVDNNKVIKASHFVFNEQVQHFEEVYSCNKLKIRNEL